MTDDQGSLQSQTDALSSVSVLLAPVILGVSPVSGPPSSLSTVTDQLTLNGLASAGVTVSIYNGATLLGTTLANAQGQWTYAVTSPLTDGAHAFSATASSGGSTSAASASVSVTVAADISSFSPLTDQWTAPIIVDGATYYVENANINGNAPWAITEVNDHTLQFTLKPTDLWQDNGSNRTEIGGNTMFAATSTVNVSYQLTVQPGTTDTSLDWAILGQFHADDDDSIVQNLTADYPIVSVHLTGAGGQGSGDYLAIEGCYLPSGSDTPIDVTSANNGFLYVSSAPITRGAVYSIQIQGSFQDNANGFLDVWVNGVEVVKYSGPIGYGTASYWKEGIYEGYTPTQTLTVDYANTIVTSTPGAPIIASGVLNGSAAALTGTAEANSKVSIYDGSTLLGSTTTTSSGTWSYTTGALASGANSITATATDSTGNVSPASLALSLSAAQVVTGGPVTVAAYLANQAALDAAGAVTINDTAAAISAAFDTINADTHVSAINLLGATTLSLDVAQALHDTHALSAIAPSTYGILITDTGANVAANFDALNTDSHITSIQPENGSQNLVLTVTQMLNDKHALSLLDPFTLMVMDKAVTFDALSTAQIAAFATSAVSELEASDADLNLTLDQTKALGSGGISVSEPNSGGTTKVFTYATDGTLARVLYQGVTGQPYTSYTINFASSGAPTSATYSNGLTKTWTFGANGSYTIDVSGIAGQAYTSYAISCAANGKPVNVVYNNGLSRTWVTNVDGTSSITTSGLTGLAFTSYTTNYGTDGKPIDANFSDGMTKTWNYNADGSSSIVLNGVVDSAITWREAMFGPSGAVIGTALDTTLGTGVLRLQQSGVSVSSSGSALSVTAGADTFALHPHTNETIYATGVSGETFNLASGFGADTILGFAAGGSSSDILSLPISMFKGLSSANTSAENVAALFADNAISQSGGNAQITDSSGDVLTLEGVTTSTLSQYASSVFKFA